MGKAKGFAIGALVVGAVGYIAGILTAPQSGKETRADIAEARDKGIAEAERQLKRMHTELNELIGEAERYVRDGDRRQELNDAFEGEVVSRASGARQKAREILSALHDGNADDRDLNKAVGEAGKAIKALRKYLQK